MYISCFLFQLFTDGRTNKLVGTWCSGHYEDMVLIRVYGNNSDLLIDRKSEINHIRVKMLKIDNMNGSVCLDCNQC